MYVSRNVTFSNSAFCLRNVFGGFVLSLDSTDITSLSDINKSVL